MLRPAFIRVVVLSVATLAFTGCSSGKANSAPAPRHSAGVITADELTQTGASNLYDAIQRLRPQWLTSSRIRRGGSGDDLQVYLDATRYGQMSSLRSISLGGVQEIRYFNASEATNRYGTGHTGGAILVMMTKQ